MGAGFCPGPLPDADPTIKNRRQCAIGCYEVFDDVNFNHAIAWQ